MRTCLFVYACVSQVPVQDGKYKYKYEYLGVKYHYEYKYSHRPVQVQVPRCQISLRVYKYSPSRTSSCTST